MSRRGEGLGGCFSEWNMVLVCSSGRGSRGKKNS